MAKTSSKNRSLWKPDRNSFSSSSPISNFWSNTCEWNSNVRSSVSLWHDWNTRAKSSSLNSQKECGGSGVSSQSTKVNFSSLVMEQINRFNKSSYGPQEFVMNLRLFWKYCPSNSRSNVIRWLWYLISFNKARSTNDLSKIIIHSFKYFEIIFYLKTNLISSWHVPSRRSPSSIPKPSILDIQDFEYHLHCTAVKYSGYLSRRSMPSFAFSNPFKIPERTKLNWSTGSVNFIKCKRISTFSDDKFMIDILASSALSHLLH